VSGRDQKKAGAKAGAMACAICGSAVARRDNPTFPFCSERCRTIDLGNWLGESYRIPTEESGDEPDAGELH